MGYSCAVVSCSNNSARNTDVRFFSLPTVKTREGSKMKELTQRRQRLWLTKLNRDIKPSSYKYTRVCADHFVRGRPAYEMRETDVDWAPTLNLCHSKVSSASAARSIKRHRRVSARRKKAKQSSGVNAAAENGSAGTRKASGNAILNLSQDDSEFVSSSDGSSHGDERLSIAQEMQLKASARDIDRLEARLKEANGQIRELHAKVECLSINEESFRNDDQKVQLYTGLPNFRLLMCTFNFVAPFVRVAHESELSRFQEFLIVLMRLRLNAPLRDLAYRFAVSVSSVGRIFDHWIPALDARLSFLIFWPDREILKRTSPVAFRQSFGNHVAVILDSFQVSIDPPSASTERASSRSNHKPQSTTKFLMGITPRGLITFISKAWGGRVSDKYITENCSILGNLLPADYVLAEKEFDVSDSDSFYCAQLAIPGHTPGKAQLCPLDTEEASKIRSIRVHIEEVIGMLLKEYPILQSTFPAETVICKDDQEDTPLDMIVRVCCALSNMCLTLGPPEWNNRTNTN